MRRCLSLAAIFCAAIAATPAAAQKWPTRAIRVIVPLTAGAATDIMARAVFDQVSHPARAADHRREPSGRRQHHRHGGGGEGGARRLHHPRQFLDPHGVARDALEADVQRAHRSRRRHPARQHAGRDGGQSEEGLQDARRLRGLRAKASPARSTTPPPAPAIPRISTASASASRPSSKPCTCRSAARRRR